MTVTVSGVITDATGREDSRQWRAFSPVYREGSGGEVVNIRPQPVRVVGGVFTAELEPGVVVLENPEGTRYTVTVPDEPAGLWELIAAAVAFPPDTSAAALASAVSTYLEENPNPDVLGLVQAAKNPDLLVTGAITLDGSNLITSAAVVWPDGSPGTLTITSRDANGAVLAYNITYGSPVSKTFSQPAITRNSAGAATNVPAIVVS